MCKALIVSWLCFLACLAARAEVLIVADEFPAMEVLAKRLTSEENVFSQLVEQTKLPAKLDQFAAVVVYIHKDLAAAAEEAFIRYAEAGGRLVLLHHSISSGKRKNRDWFKFLGVELPEDSLEQGGYKWIEGVQVQWINLAPDHYVMTNKISFPETQAIASPSGVLRVHPSFELVNTEVYLNHVLNGSHTLLMGLHYSDATTHQTWNQSTAGWLRPAGKGWIAYFMPGHTLHDFENPVYGRIVLNAITAPASQFR